MASKSSLRAQKSPSFHHRKSMQHFERMVKKTTERCQSRSKKMQKIDTTTCNTCMFWPSNRWAKCQPKWHLRSQHSDRAKWSSMAGLRRKRDQTGLRVNLKLCLRCQIKDGKPWQLIKPSKDSKDSKAKPTCPLISYAILISQKWSWPWYILYTLYTIHIHAYYKFYFHYNRVPCISAKEQVR